MIKFFLCLHTIYYVIYNYIIKIVQDENKLFYKQETSKCMTKKMFF